MAGLSLLVSLSVGMLYGANLVRLESCESYDSGCSAPSVNAGLSADLASKSIPSMWAWLL